MSQIINGHNYHGKVRTIKIDDYPDKLMFFHEDISETVQLRLDHFFTKERETISWIKNHMDKESVFWDIGANIGQYGIFASIIHKCKTYLIEPEPQNFSNLCINILLNNLKYTNPISIALSDKSEYSSIDMKPNAGNSQNKINKDYFFNHYLWVDTVDNLVSKHFIAPTHLKIDVDGVELKILKGASNTLKNVKSILVEAHPDEEKELFELLEDFKLESKNQRSQGVFNYIFIK